MQTALLELLKNKFPQGLLTFDQLLANVPRFIRHPENPHIKHRAFNLLQ